MTRAVADRRRLLDAPRLRSAAAWVARWAVPLAALILVLVQLRTDARISHVWRGWRDQEFYLQAARAWAAGNLDPSQHHYPPGYALLAVPFMHVTPTQPFLIPDLICSVAALLVFTRVCRRLAPDFPHVEAVAAGCFLACTAIGEKAIALWVIPWTTTPTAPLLLTCLLMALRYGATLRARELGFMGAAAGIGAMMRPSDAGLIFVACTGYCFILLLATRPAPGLLLRHSGFLIGGLCLGLLPGAVAHVLVHGFSSGGYIGASAALGFEWRLIPQRWVVIAINPRPLFFRGTGMAAVFPWLLPGIAGMMACLATARSRNLGANALLAVTVCLYWALYLAYRDLNPYALWRYNNVHYFKWTLPFLMFWAVCLVRALAARPRAWQGWSALAAAVLLFCWRPVFVPDAQGVETTHGQTALLPGGLTPISRTFLLPAAGNWHPLFFGHAQLLIGGQTFEATRDFKIYPVNDAVMIMPLRVLPSGDATIVMPEGVTLPQQANWVSGNFRLQFGVPCLVTPRSPECKPGPYMPDETPRAGG